MHSFRLRLEETYWNKGFFNVPVDHERFLTSVEGALEIRLGDGSESISGRISRTANSNATPRIYGKKALIEFFHANFKQGGFVDVEIVADNVIRIHMPT